MRETISHRKHPCNIYVHVDFEKRQFFSEYIDHVYYHPTTLQHSSAAGLNSQRKAEFVFCKYFPKFECWILNFNLNGKMGLGCCQVGTMEEQHIGCLCHCLCLLIGICLRLLLSRFGSKVWMLKADWSTNGLPDGSTMEEHIGCCCHCLCFSICLFHCHRLCFCLLVVHTIFA